MDRLLKAAGRIMVMLRQEFLLLHNWLMRMVMFEDKTVIPYNPVGQGIVELEKNGF